MKFILSQKFLSIGDDFIILNENKDKVYKVDGKILTLTEKLNFNDTKGNKIYTIRKKLLKFKETYVIEEKGEVIATLRKDLLNIFKDRFELESPYGEIRIKGNFLDYNYNFKLDGKEIAKVSKKFLTIRDKYVLDIKNFPCPELLLCSCVIIDMICHDNNDKKKSDD